MVGIKTDVATMKKSREVHQKLKIEPPYEPEILISGYFSKKTKQKRKLHGRKRDMHTHTFLYLTEHYLQQPRYGKSVSVHWCMDEWRNVC